MFFQVTAAPNSSLTRILYFIRDFLYQLFFPHASNLKFIHCLIIIEFLVVGEGLRTKEVYPGRDLKIIMKNSIKMWYF